MRESIKEVLKSELPQGDDYPQFQPGDLIRVITLEDIGGQRRERVFEGVCISRRGAGIDETFKVRKISFGVGVERIFPLYSAIINEIKIVRKGHVRRSKLNYLAGRSAKKSRIKERRVDLDELNASRAEAEEPEPEEEVVEESPEPEEEAIEEETAEETGAEETEESEEQPKE
jgi:large subunit ribosomal protein L19